MEPTQFPANSSAAKAHEADQALPSRVKQVTTGEVKRKKRSLRRQFSEAFVGGDLKTSSRYVLFDILLPGARDMIWESVSGGFERLIFGDGRRRSSHSSPPHRPEYTNYSNYSSVRNMVPAGRSLTRARSRHNFDDVVLESRSEAEQTLDQMFEVLSTYGTVTVADFYQIVGLAPAHTDYKWGWTDLQGSRVSRDNNGYLLDLPDPSAIQ